MKPITSGSNPRVKQLLKLARSSRERRKIGLTVLDGIHLVEAFLKSGGQPELIAISEVGAADLEIVNIINNLRSIPLMQLGNALFRQISPVETPAGIVAVVKTVRPTLTRGPTVGACVLLEDIQDPGNLGTILRTAAAAGLEEIYLSGSCADAWSPRTLRAGMGAHFAVRIYEDVNLPEFARNYGGTVVATCGDATLSVFEAKLSGDIALILGNEGSGVSPQLRSTAQLEVRIPMSDKVESLNVAAAAAVCFFERVRQTQKDEYC